MDETSRALPVLFGLVAASAANGVTAALRATASAAMRFDLIWSLLRSGLATEANRASRRDSVWIGGRGRASGGLLSTPRGGGVSTDAGASWPAKLPSPPGGRGRVRAATRAR